ncbi:Tom37 C-terminal domain-containing protein [Scheffersomyces amazonensis]|uniref:Tom37 C-terminal domain-containing protein n=1 Tax=Scheffersomyces amazonensis TaxID=1078765 RepID=UPI00315DC381
MLKLHVWGEGPIVSIISPECIAATWILTNNPNIPVNEYEIITSSNTNLSDIHKLPTLIVDNSEKIIKYQGFQEIVSFLEQKFVKESKSSPILSSKSQLNVRENLINVGLITQLLSKIEYIHQYNLFINSKNYEGYVRKLFSRYLPFPMMYNQPLKFYNQAQAQVQLIGLNRGKVGFFSLSGNQDTTQTEYFNNDVDDDAYDDSSDDIESTKPLSALHERSIISKSKEKQMLEQSKNSMRCMNLLNSYLDYFFKAYQEFHPGTNSYGTIFHESKLSTSEVLLIAYIYCLTFDELPDRFIHTYLKFKHSQFLEFADNISSQFSTISKKGNIRGPVSEEIPSLYNEIKYWTGAIKY